MNDLDGDRNPSPTDWRVGKSERHADTTSRRLEANVYPQLGRGQSLRSKLRSW
jgi:hypothetical protein